LKIFDVGDPTNPRQVGHYNTGGYPRNVYVAGSYAYVADGTAGLAVIDISDPTQPRQVGSYDLAMIAFDVAVADGYAYLADYQTGLHVVDVRDPAHPRRVGGNTSFAAQALTVTDNLVLMASLNEGLIILNRYHPIELRQISRTDEGMMRLRLSGPPEMPARLQRSTNLHDWENWRTFSFGTESLEFSDPDSSSCSRRFYRIAAP
jgi:hypothetical protein